MVLCNTHLFNSEAALFHLADVIRTIKDPEKPNTLEDLNVVYEEGITVSLLCNIQTFPTMRCNR